MYANNLYSIMLGIKLFMLCSMRKRKRNLIFKHVTAPVKIIDFINEASMSVICRMIIVPRETPIK
jgi:uncharacterized membrane protein